MCDNIEKLKKITSQLPPIPTLGEFKSANGEITEYKFKNGTAISFPIFDEQDASIAKTFISKNTEFEKHLHIESYEIIIILSGILQIEKEGYHHILKKYDKIIISENVPHSAIALEDVWFLAITIPKDENFPRKPG